VSGPATIDAGVRTLVVRCPDWPLTALGVGPAEPALVLASGRVVAATPAAREAGVVRGERLREAQFRCPEVRVLERDDSWEARRFEAVAAALQDVTPWLEAWQPGSCAFGVRGPVRLSGGEANLVCRTARLVAAVLDDLVGSPTGHPGCGIGVADGRFAAGLAAGAADASVPDGGGAVVVPPGGVPSFLAPQPITVLGHPALVDVLARLGLETLGAFAALPAADVVARFGAEGRDAHRLASGIDGRPPDPGPVPPDLAVSVAFDPPVERVDRAAFAARSLAEALHGRLSDRGLACTLVLVEAETEHGERLARRWRDEGVLGPGAVADRVRWQLEGWLNGPPATRPTSGITRLVLVPDEVVPAIGRQQGFWGGVSASDERAARACTRVEALLGPGSVRVPEWRGGRDPGEHLALVPFVRRMDDESGHPSRVVVAAVDGPPWPGMLPGPLPAAVHVDPIIVEVRDAAGRMVEVDGRGVLSAPPHLLVVASPVRRSAPGGSGAIGEGGRVVAWAGPWPLDERWWDPGRRRRSIRLQVVTADGAARLVVLEGGVWRVAATYD
tara:strand:- start:292 stop:1965 length:1674 start_codon:yes stop_codon:yes gene_type:complete